MDGIENADGSSASGFDDGSNIGVEMGGPFGPEAVRHFSKDDAGAQRLLGAVIGGRDGAIVEEDEQISPAALDGVLELFASGMGWRDAEQRIEAGVELVAVGA